MTANQIEYGAAREAMRHNEVTEKETERHNRATEDLQREANAINDRIAENNRLYNEQKNRIQAEYNDKYLEMQTAQGNRRLELQEELNLINERKNENERRFNVARVELEAVKNDISKRQTDELSRHNQVLETVDTYDKQMKYFYEEKSLKYARERMDRENAQAWYKLNTDRLNSAINEYAVYTRAERDFQLLPSEKRLNEEKSWSELYKQQQTKRETDLSFARTLFGSKGVFGLLPFLVR